MSHVGPGGPAQSEGRPSAPPPADLRGKAEIRQTDGPHREPDHRLTIIAELELDLTQPHAGSWKSYTPINVVIRA